MGKTFPWALCNRGSGGEQGSVVGAAPRGQGAAMAGMQGAGLVVPFSPCFRGKKKCLHPHLNTLLKIFSFALKAGGRLGCWLMFFPSFPF